MSDQKPPFGPAPVHDEIWFQEWFDTDFYLQLYSHRDKAEAEACVRLVLESIALPAQPGTRPAALDLACGAGRHAITLAQHGFDVTAVDLSTTLLKYARSEAEAEAVDIRFIQSDMRDVEFDGEFDLAVQLFTSFGYFDSPADDLLVLQHVRRSLRDGGYYALDLLNEQQLRSALVPASVRYLDDVAIHEERRFVEDRVVKRITIPMEGGALEFNESVRLYSPERIERMLRDCGFVPEAWFGDYDGSDFVPERSKRMFIISRAAPLEREERFAE